MGTLRRRCATVLQPWPSELPFGVVRAVGRSIAVLDGSTSCKGKWTFWGFLFSFFTMENAIGSPTVKCFWFVCEYLTTFCSANVSLESSIPGVFGNIFDVDINVDVYEKLAKKLTTVLPKLKCKQQTVAARGAITAAAAADGQLAYSWMHATCIAAPATPRAARPDAARSLITLGKFVSCSFSLV